MGSWTAASVLHNQLICFPSVGVTSSAINPKCSPRFLKGYEIHSRRNFGLCVVENRYKIWASGVIESSRALTYLQTQQGTWEEPNDGSGSDYDDDEEEDDGQVEEDNNDFESDWEEVEETKTSAINGVDNTSGNKYKENIVKEVEQLLEPEERAILEQNVTPNLEKISHEKWSLLHTLSLSAQISCMDKLLENGFDIDFINNEGLTALHKAIIGKKEAVISHLLRKGASPHVKDKDGATPLHHAVQVGAMQTVKLLIKYKVDVNVADNEGWTPLHIAIQSRNRDIAKILLVNGADKTRRNKDGKTALDLSLCYGKDFKSYDLARLLKVVPANRDF